MMGVRVRTIATGCVSTHAILITDQGQCYSWGMLCKFLMFRKGLLRAGAKPRITNSLYFHPYVCVLTRTEFST